MKSGDRIAFLGDSITEFGNWSDGYVNMVMLGLEANGIEAVKIPAGISGHKATQMSERLERDVLSKDPQVMTLSCGVNDVWHGKNGVPLETYKELIADIVDRAQAKGVRVYILTATMIGEDASNANNRKLAPYNDFLRTLATEKKCVLVDLNAEMQRQVAACREKYPKMRGNFLTVDGVHMHPDGNRMMATEILRAFGLTDAQIAKARPMWMKMVFPRWGDGSFTLGDYEKAKDKAFASGVSVHGYLDRLAKENLPPRSPAREFPEGLPTTNIMVKSGERIAFLGDTVTAQGAWPTGYGSLVVSALAANGVKVAKTIVGRGGDGSAQLLARLEKDVLPRKPQVLMILCCLNDSGVSDRSDTANGWRNQKRPVVPVDLYKKNLLATVGRAQAEGIRVYLLTSTIVGEKPDDPENMNLASYDEALREIARERKCGLVEVHDALSRGLSSLRSSHGDMEEPFLTFHGIYLNPIGSIIVAKEILRSLGLDEMQIARGEEKWMEQPFGWFAFPFTIRSYLQVSEQAFQDKMSIWGYLKELL